MGDKETKQVSLWQDRISTSRKWRDAQAEEGRWETYLDEYEGKYDVVLGSAQVPPINEVFAYTQTAISNLFKRDPYIAVNATKTGTIAGAYILEAALNHHWRVMNIKDEVELEIMDAIHVGHGWNKVGNNVKTTGDGDQLHIESENLFANRVSWRDMLMNIGTRRPLVDSLWAAQRIYRPTDDVKKDYGAAAAKLNGSPHPSLTEQVRKSMLYKDDVNFSALYEVWDARERKIYLMAEENTRQWLEDPRPWPDYLKEFPYQFLSFNPIVDKAYPMSDIAPWNPQALEKIKIFTMMLNHVKRWNRQMVMRKGTMTDSELDKFEKGIDGAILKAATSGMNSSLQDAFKLLDFGALPPDIYLILDRIDQLMQRISGQNFWDQGGQAKTQSRTLGEAEMMKGGSGNRTDRKLDRIESHCAKIARHLMFHMKANFDVPQMVKITGNEPPEIIKAFADQGRFDPKSQTIRFNKDDITGEYDVTVKSGSTLALDKGTRDQILDQVMQNSVQLAQLPTVPPFLQEVIKERLKDYGIKSLEAAFDEQNQQAEQMKQAQAEESNQSLNKVAAETEKRAAQANQIQVDTALKTAQAIGRASGELHPELEIAK